MEKLKKFLIALAIIWGVVLVVLLLTFQNWEPKIELWKFIVLSFIITMGIITAVDTVKKPFQHRTQTPCSTKKAETFYVFEGEFGRTLLWRIENNKIYPGTSNQFKYEIKGDKICFAGSAKFLYQIRNNRLYKPGDPKVTYKIENNRVYKGELGRNPVYRITTSQLKDR